MRIEPVPEIGFGHGIPRPVGWLEILEDDTRVLVLLRGIAPDVKVPLRATSRRPARSLKPWVLIRGVIDNQFSDDSQNTAMRFLQKYSKILERAVNGINGIIVSGVIAIVLQRRRI